MTGTGKYDLAAAGWSDEQYADSAGYLRHRAELVQVLGPKLEPGDTVLDLACGDAGLAEPLLDAGLRYVGVDLSGPMVEAARRRVGGRVEIVEGDLNGFAPFEPVQATTCFRAVYYARDRRAFFRHVASYTEKKVVFDLNPRQYRVADVCADLDAAGLSHLELRPFFSPQRVALPAPLAAAMRAAERSGPLARLALRFRFSYIVAASRSAEDTVGTRPLGRGIAGRAQAASEPDPLSPASAAAAPSPPAQAEPPLRTPPSY